MNKFAENLLGVIDRAITPAEPKPAVNWQHAIGSLIVASAKDPVVRDGDLDGYLTGAKTWVKLWHDANVKLTDDATIVKYRQHQAEHGRLARSSSELPPGGLKTLEQNLSETTAAREAIKLELQKIEVENAELARPISERFVVAAEQFVEARTKAETAELLALGLAPEQSAVVRAAIRLLDIVRRSMARGLRGKPSDVLPFLKI